MNIRIGANLKKLRIARGLTQEQLADVFGVSAQAVSRWENDTAYPDITMLPGIAMFYETSIDEIVGMEEIRSKDRLWRVHCEVNRLVENGQLDEAVQLVRDNLRLYPNNSGLLMTLGETLARRADGNSLNEAISIGERVLASSDISTKARSTTMVNLIFLYIRAGRNSAAEDLVRSLPHIWEARELMLPELSGDDYADELKKAVMKLVTVITDRILSIPARERGRTPEYVQLGANFEPTMDVKDMLEIIAGFLSGR